MKTSPRNEPDGLPFTVEMTNTEFSELRDAIIDKFGSEDKLKEWQRGRFIKLSYGIATGFRPRREEELK